MSEILIEVSRTQYATVVIDGHVIDELMDMTLREYIEEYLENDFESDEVEVKELVIE